MSTKIGEAIASQTTNQMQIKRANQNKVVARRLQKKNNPMQIRRANTNEIKIA
jgi:hypothetical protein